MNTLATPTSPPPPPLLFAYSIIISQYEHCFLLVAGFTYISHISEVVFPLMLLAPPHTVDTNSSRNVSLTPNLENGIALAENGIALGEAEELAEEEELGEGGGGGVGDGGGGGVGVVGVDAASEASEASYGIFKSRKI